MGDINKGLMVVSNQLAGAHEEVKSLATLATLAPPQDSNLNNEPERLASLATLASPPELLRREPVKAEPYPIDLLGDVLGGAVRALTENVQCPDVIAAQSALGIASLVSQPFRNVVLPHGQKIALSLFMITVADSGDRKSGADNVLMHPIADIEETWQSQYDEDLKKFDRELKAYKVVESRIISKGKKDANKGSVEKELEDLGDPPEPPKCKRLTVEDGTMEGIFRVLNDCSYAGLFSDEGGIFAGGFSMGKEQILSTITRLSKNWDGKPVDRVRGGEGAKRLYGRRLALHQMMQPIVAKDIFSNDVLNNQGFIPRCLCVHAKSKAGYRKYKAVNVYQHKDIKTYHNCVMDLLNEHVPYSSNNNGSLLPNDLSMNHDAALLYAQFHDAVENEMIEDGAYYSIKKFAGKLAEHAARIAGVLGVFETGNHIECIDGKLLARGINIATYYAHEMIRVIEKSSIDLDIELAEKLYTWSIEKGIYSDDPNFKGKYIYSNVIIQYHPIKELRSKKALKPIAKILSESGHFTPCSKVPLDGGVRRTVWRINSD